MGVKLMQNKYYFFCKQLGQSPSTNHAMSRKRGVKMEMERGGSILAPTLFDLKLPVALGRVLGKIAIWQRLLHTHGVIQTQYSRHKDHKEVLQVSSSCSFPSRCANRLAKKRKTKKLDKAK